MADIITNTLQIGSNNLVLRDADAQEQLVTVKDGLSAVESDVTDLKEDIEDIEEIGLSVVDGALNITYTED